MEQDDLITLATLGTLAGATAATVVVGNTVQSLFNYSAKWLSFIVAEAILLLVAASTETTELSGYLMAALNGCFVYSSAVGLNTMTAPAAPPTEARARSASEAGLPAGREQPGASRRFFQRWW